VERAALAGVEEALTRDTVWLGSPLSRVVTTVVTREVGGTRGWVVGGVVVVGAVVVCVVAGADVVGVVAGAEVIGEPGIPAVVGEDECTGLWDLEPSTARITMTATMLPTSAAFL
jgi:hypothetical protein